MKCGVWSVGWDGSVWSVGCGVRCVGYGVWGVSVGNAQGEIQTRSQTCLEKIHNSLHKALCFLSLTHEGSKYGSSISNSEMHYIQQHLHTSNSCCTRKTRLTRMTCFTILAIYGGKRSKLITRRYSCITAKQQFMKPDYQHTLQFFSMQSTKRFPHFQALHRMICGAPLMVSALRASLQTLDT